MNPIRRLSIAAAAAALSCLALSPARAADPPFEAHWQDGKAELDGYRYTVTRYGEPRRGQAVMIFVTEPFRESTRVKADDPSRNPSDVFEALKLNLVRDFQTGIYDYNTMTSVYARSRDFSASKISFSSQEWCGSVHEEILFGRAGVRQSLRSYFEGESGERSLAAPAGGVAEDNLFILLRGLRGPFLNPGASRSVPFLPGAFARRLAHRALAWTTATIERLDRAETVAVPAGRFETDVYVVRVEGAGVGRFWIEKPYPHRVVRWKWMAPVPAARLSADGTESGELSGSARLAYWQRHENGHERYLKTLGLEPLPASGAAPTP